MSVYDIDGNRIDAAGGGSTGFVEDESLNIYDKMCRSINHRGWTNDGAVENSLQAYKESKTKGFYYVETDVRWTSDDEAILFHDDRINGVFISNMTYAEVLAAVPTIAKFEPFIALCRDIGLHPYIEIKGTHTTEQVSALINVVKDYCMLRKVTWFSATVSNLYKVQAFDPSARLGILASVSSTSISNALTLKNGTGDVFLDCSISSVTSTAISDAKAAGIPLEVYSYTWATSEITGMDRYITGFTSDYLIAGKVLYDAAMA